MPMWTALLLAVAPLVQAGEEQARSGQMDTVMTDELEAELLEAINSGWGWNGTTIAEVLDVSPMGHMLLSDGNGGYYYLDTDGMRLTLLGDHAAAQAAMAREEARELWSGGELVRSARRMLGEPPTGHTFTLSPLNWIDGQYSAENMVILPLAEIAFLSGDLARQMRDLHDGTQVQTRVVD